MKRHPVFMNWKTILLRYQYYLNYRIDLQIQCNPYQNPNDFPDSSVDKESTCNARDPGLIPGSRRSTGEEIGYPLQYSWAFLVAQLVKNLPAMRETWFDPWVGKIPWRRERLPTLVFCPGEFHGLYSRWGCKELDVTEWLSLHFNRILKAFIMYPLINYQLYAFANIT